MPPRKAKGGWKNPGTKGKPMSKKKAMSQHRAIKARQSGRSKRRY